MKCLDNVNVSNFFIIKESLFFLSIYTEQKSSSTIQTKPVPSFLFLFPLSLCMCHSITQSCARMTSQVLQTPSRGPRVLLILSPPQKRGRERAPGAFWHSSTHATRSDILPPWLFFLTTRSKPLAPAIRIII